MIRFLKRNQIDQEKYNQCVENSEYSELYAFSWYLDVVADNWGAFVLDDYQAVMPIPNRNKLSVSYVYQPFWTLQLGVFGTNEIDGFIEELVNKFRYVELRLNPSNIVYTTSFVKNEKQILTISNNFLLSSLRKDRQKDLRKAEKANLTFQNSVSPESLIHLFRNNIGTRTPNIKDKDYKVLSILCELLLKKGFGNLFEVYENDTMIAGAFMLIYKKKATILFSSTDFKNRNNGSNTFLIAKIIEEYKDRIQEFDFGGSSIRNIANYFKSFGAETITYPFLKIDNLTFLVKQIKKMKN